MKLLALITALVALTLTAAVEPQTNLADVEDEVMCPICGTVLELSEAPQAQRERVFIRELIAEGQTKEQIKDALVAEYGEEVLAVPDTKGFDLLAWLVPGVGLLAAAIGIGFGLRRWRRSSATAGPASSGTIDPTDEGRLDSDLARYDL